MTTRGPQYLTKAACCRSQVLVVTVSLCNASLYPSVFIFYSFLVGTDEVQVAEDCDSQDFDPK